VHVRQVAPFAHQWVQAAKPFPVLKSCWLNATYANVKV
jgi:hypothetical protein